MNAYTYKGGMCLPIILALSLMSMIAAHMANAQVEPGARSPRPAESEARVKGINESDDKFVKDAVAKFGDRRAASQAMALQGWSAMRESKVELALRRFNESRLLDPKNYLAYWGRGAVLSEQGKLREAIEQLEIATELIGDSDERINLLADVGALYSQYAATLPPDAELERARAFVTANQRFTESLEISPDYARSWREWAISLYHQERFSEAWIKAERAIELKAEAFPANFLERLKEKVSYKE